MWTVVLLLTSGTAVWLSAKHWWGWAIGAASEVLWAAYALTIHSPALLIMSAVWFFIHGRNAIVTRKEARGTHQ